MRSALVTLMIGVAPMTAHAQLSGQVTVDLNLGAAPGEPIDSVDVFYDQLAPYGVWVDDPSIGREAFIPDDPNFVPYTRGHWAYTDLGTVWVSNEPFAWATSHYGRWWLSDALGRWEWIPDTQWAPSWVEWQGYGDYIGWVPMAPDFIYERGYRPPIEAYHFCAPQFLFAVDV